ncbi:MAG: hypothetical protein ACYYKD_10790 [Rhodospirillales bacterium]
MIEATHRSGQFIYDYQPLIAGLLALGAAVLTALYLRKQIKASVEEGKRERDFRTEQHKRERDFRRNQHEIEIQTKRRAVAVMLAADIGSGIKPEELGTLAEIIEKEAEALKHFDEGKSPPLPFFPPVGKSVLINYSHYIKDMPLMRVETIEEVSQLYIFATVLFNAMEISNSKMEGIAKVEGLATNKTRASFLVGVSTSAKNTKSQSEQTLRLLTEEVAMAQKELDRLKIVQEKLTAGAPSPFDTRPAGATQDEGGGKQTP